MAKRGKQGDARYASVSGRIPKKLRSQFKAKIADYDDTLTVDIFLERVITLWVTGALEIGVPNEPTPPVTSEVYEPIQASEPDNAQSQASEPDNAVTGSTDAVMTQSSEPDNAQNDDTPPSLELAAIRQKLGMNQRQFAKALNTSQPTLSRYEKGQNAVPQSVLLAARDALQHSE